ncbi:phage late control D family protein, partial [bacterium]|nr:phage late control D family protein [bacterium]
MSMVLDKSILAQPYFDIYINGNQISKEAKRSVVSVEYEESDSDADLIRLTVNDYTTTFIDDTGLEKEAKIKLIFGHVNNYREVEGIVSIIEADFTDKGEFVLNIVAIDKTNNMTSKKKTRTWKKVKRSDVVRSIAGEYGFKAIVKDTGEVLDQITQDDETDAQLIKKMADSEALQFYYIQESNTIYFDERFKDFKVKDTLYYN